MVEELLLREVVPKGSRARLFDAQGRMRANVNRLYERPSNPALLDPARTHLFNALLYRFFEWLITARGNVLGQSFKLENTFLINQQELQNSIHQQTSFGAADVRRYVSSERDQLMGSLVPVQDDATEQLFLLFESNEDTANAFTSSAMVRMFSLVTLIGLLVAVSLFTYATWLSWRIRRLSREAKSAVSGDGRLLNTVKSSLVKDEIGDMSRSIAQLVERSAGYTQYLESLASKLSHELRTPLSVVQTSLENIEAGEISNQDRVLLERAQGGASQLSALIRSMSEAARLEQTVQRSEFVRFDTATWLEHACAAYENVYASQAFRCDLDNLHDKSLLAVPELLQQALDKLVANAVDFATAASVITIRGRDEGTTFTLSVTNHGVAFDGNQINQLFEPMYSQRTMQNGEPHLGLGLYIVRLIAEAHGGVAYAQNLADRGAVEIGFSVVQQKVKPASQR